MRLLFATALLSLCTNFCFAIERHAVHLQFATDAQTLSAEAKQQLNELLCQVPQDFEYQIEIKGHTDAVGSQNYNARLAGNRAEAVKDYLLLQGIEKSAIALSSFGETRLLTTENSQSARQKNRRVELTLVIYRFDSVEELEETLSAQAKTETVINSQRPNALVGKQGTQIYLPANSFVSANGEPYSGEVKITLQEALSVDQFLSNHLATQTEDAILISGGMFKLSAETPSGEELTLDSNQSLTTAVPVTNGVVNNNMQQFTSANGLYWQVSNNPVNDYLNWNMPPIPALEFRPFPEPRYPGYKRPKPIEPEVWTEPRMPTKPNAASFEPDLSLVERPLAIQLKRKAEERFKEAMTKYEENVNLYWRKKELYDAYTKDYADACKRYSADLERWKVNRKRDSLTFIDADEQLLVRQANLKAKALALKKYRAKKAAWDSLYSFKADSVFATLEAKGIATEQMADLYVSSVKQLSWINIDRFYKLHPSEQHTITLYGAEKSNARSFIVFKNMKSLLPFNLKEIDGKLAYQREGMPKSERCALLSYTVENGKALVYYKDFNPKNTHRIKYQTMDFSDFKALLNQLDV